MKKNQHLLFLLFVLSFSSLFAQSYYVAPDGDNDNDGTSLSEAWESIQHAMDNATAGSTVYIRGGTYHEKVYVNVDGTSGNFITFMNYNDETVILDGTGLPDPNMIEVYNANYIRIIGLDIRNNIQNSAAGILIEEESSYIEIRDCKISAIHFSSNPNDDVNTNTNSNPILVYGTVDSYPIEGLVIDGNEVFDCRTGFSEALAVNGNVTDFVVSNNIVHDISNIGIDIIGHEGTSSSEATDQARNGIVSGNTVYRCQSPYATAAGIYVDGAKDIVVENNVVYDNQWGIEIGCENVGKSAANIIVRNNVIYNNTTSGIALGGYDYPTGSGKVENCQILHNTTYHNDTQNDYEGEMVLSYSENCTIMGNVFYADNNKNHLFILDQQANAPQNLVIDYNLWYIPAGIDDAEVYWAGTSYDDFEEYRTGTGHDANSVFADPLFKDLNLTSFDAHIPANSPARNAGSVSFSPAPNEVDIDGEARVHEGQVDLGADEFYYAAGIADWFNQNQQKRLHVFPNPSHGQITVDLTLPQHTDIQLVCYNSLGQHIFVQSLGRISAGQHRWTFDLSHLESGLYHLSLDGEGHKAGATVWIQ